MPRREPLPKALVLAAIMAWTLSVAHAPRALAEEPGAPFRHQATITVDQPGAYVRLPLPVSAYANSRQPGLADLRIVDARGERVPFALLAARANQAQATDAARPAALYPLPPRRAGEAELRSPLEVQVVGDRITVRRLGPTAAGPGNPARPSSATGPTPGWLFDLGERARDEALPTALRLAWLGPVEFSAAFDLEVSDDLRQWRRAGGGQLLALNSHTGRLTQPDVLLPAPATARFVRLRWVDPANAPVLSAAEQLRPLRSSVVLDPPTALVVQPVSEPVAAGPGGAAARLTSAAAEDSPAGALHYDLGAVLPVVEIDLPLTASHRVAPVRVQGRSRSDEPWRDVALTVFYRLERAGAVDRPPPLALALQASVRFLRLVPDPRSGPLPATPLAVKAQLISVVFAAQGQAPYRLLAGSTAATPGALPLATLVPAIEEERPRLGRAALGPWSENEAVAREEAWRQRVAQWRPVLLWAVLLLGLGGLAAMVWRLARPGSAD